ncbi:hypothetical protein KM043_004183 [Ampulex compressa]|nr:hypothetical protein KM043_004183 [Ampulex compressa]
MPNRRPDDVLIVAIAHRSPNLAARGVPPRCDLDSRGGEKSASLDETPIPDPFVALNAGSFVTSSPTSERCDLSGRADRTNSSSSGRALHGLSGRIDTRIKIHQKGPVIAIGLIYRNRSLLS